MDFILYDRFNYKYQRYIGQSANQERHMHNSIAKLNSALKSSLEISMNTDIEAGYEYDDSLFEKFRNEYNKDSNDIISLTVRD